MQRPLFTVLVLLMIIGTGRTAAANLELEFSVHSETAQGPEMKDKVMHDSVMKVVLGKDFFSYTEGRSRSVYDFRTRRIYTINPDPATAVQSDDSLYSVIGFRAAEFEHREELSDTLQGAKIKKQLITTAFIEHLYSISAGHGHAKVSETNGNGTIIFRAEGKDLLSWSTAGTPADEEELRLFVRFFRYYLGGHPAILRQLRTSGMIPNTIKFFLYDIGREEARTLSLLSLNRTTDAPFVLQEVKRVASPANRDEVSRIIEQGQGETPFAVRKKNEAVLKAADRALAQSRYWESMLGYQEYALRTGKPLPAACERSRKKMLRDRNVRDFLLAINPKNAEEAQQSLQTLIRLHRGAARHAQVLLVFEARIQARFGKGDEAGQLYVLAIRQNPYLAVTYKEMGDLSFSSLDMRRAWQCWEQCRRLAPSYRDLKKIDELERRLVNEHAEFF